MRPQTWHVIHPLRINVRLFSPSTSANGAQASLLICRLPGEEFHHSPNCFAATSVITYTPLLRGRGQYVWHTYQIGLDYFKNRKERVYALRAHPGMPLFKNFTPDLYPNHIGVSVP